MSPITTIIEHSDFYTLIILIVLLNLVGSPFVARAPELHNLGLRIAAGVGLLYAGMIIAERGLGTAPEITALVLRSLAAGGVVLGPAWIVLSVFAYFRDHLRRMSDASGARADARRRERVRRKEEAKEQERRRWADKEWEHTRPERERAEREATERRQRETEQKGRDQRRRADARATCEFEYAINAPEIGGRFPKSEFDAFVNRYCSDQQQPEEVEQRAQQLLGIIEQHLNRSVPPRPKSLGELAAWFEKQRADLTLISDEQTRRLMLIKLKERYDELSSQLLEDLAP